MQEIEELKEILSFLEDIDCIEFEFKLKQVQELTGITKNRIQYWTDSDHIRKEDKDKRYYYSPREIRKILLINKLHYNKQEKRLSLEASDFVAEELLTMKNKELAARILLVLINITNCEFEEIIQILEK